MHLFSHPIVWCLVSAFLFGISPALSKWALVSIPPISLASLLYWGAGVSTLPFSGMPNLHGRKEWMKVVGAVLCGGVLGPIFLLYGISELGAARSALLLNFESVATVLLGWFFFREHVSKEILISALLVTMAGVLLSTSGGGSEFSLQWGALWIVLACFCWGIDNHCTALIEQITPTQSTCIKGLCAGLLNGMIAWHMGEELVWDVSVLCGGLLMGGVCYGASIVLYIAGAQQIGATRAQLIFSSAPYWGIVVALVFLGEDFTMLHVMALFLMLVSLWVQNAEAHVHAHKHDKRKHRHWHQHDDLHHDHEHGEEIPLHLGWHSHEHVHEECVHAHEHHADVHHRHH